MFPTHISYNLIVSIVLLQSPYLSFENGSTKILLIYALHVKIQNFLWKRRKEKTFINKSLVNTKKEVGLLSCRYAPSVCISFCCGGSC